MDTPSKRNSDDDPYVAITGAARRFHDGDLAGGLDHLARVLLEQPDPGYPVGTRERFERKLAAATAGIRAFDPARLAATAMFEREHRIPMHYVSHRGSSGSVDLAAEWDAAIMEAIEAIKRREVPGQDETGEIIK